MIKGIYCSVLAVGAGILLNCNEADNPVSGTQFQDGATASAFIKVQNVKNEAPVKGVLVTIEGNGSCTTNVNGVARFDDLCIGSHVISASLAGYEPVVSELIIHADSSYSTPLALQTSMSLLMYRKGTVVRGKIYYQKENALYPISQMSVELELSPSIAVYDGWEEVETVDFLQPVRSVKTLPDGSYFFDSIPEFTVGRLITQNHQVGGVLYGRVYGEIIYSKAAGDTNNFRPIILTPEINGHFTILSDNSDSITGSTAFSITFSEPVDTSRYNPNGTYINGASLPGRVLHSQKWNKTVTVLSLKPFDGVWQPGEMYTVTVGTVYSISGKMLLKNRNITFKVAFSSAETDVKNLRLISPETIDYGTASVRLQWSKLPGVRGYEIYARASSDSIWSIYFASELVHDTSIVLSTYGKFIEGNTFEVMVLGVYDSTKSDPANATILKLRDNTRPKITSSSAGTVYTVYDCNNSASSASLLRQLYSPLRFSEPMDTTKKPTFTVKEASYSYYGDSTYVLPKDSVRCSWSTLTQLVVQAVIPASKNAAYDSIVVDFSNITDRNGNKVSFSGSNELPIIKYSTR
ncbi:MAG: hypothetical protein JW915_07450 [Chitinispirillaceae bacterium]|nr:hypothetical protein [Chitinispirillaceae bacterium]